MRFLRTLIAVEHRENRQDLQFQKRMNFIDTNEPVFRPFKNHDQGNGKTKTHYSANHSIQQRLGTGRVFR